MANQGFGFPKVLGGAAFFSSAIAIGTTDAVFNISGGYWVISAIVGGLIGWGVAHGEVGAGGGVVASAALLFAFSLFMGMS